MAKRSPLPLPGVPAEGHAVCLVNLELNWIAARKLRFKPTASTRVWDWIDNRLFSSFDVSPNGATQAIGRINYLHGKTIYFLTLNV